MTAGTKSTRFSRTSDIIDVKKLERETNRLLALGVVVGIIIHVTVGYYITFKRTGYTPVKSIPVVKKRTSRWLLLLNAGTWWKFMWISDSGEKIFTLTHSEALLQGEKREFALNLKK